MSSLMMETELGLMPTDWKLQPLGELLYIKGRIGWKGLKKSEYLDDGYAIINGEQIKNDKVNWNTVGRISEERFLESPEIMLKENDILMTKDGTIGKIAFIDALPEKATVASGVFVIRQNSNTLSQKYLFNYFKSRYFKWLIKGRIEGSVIPHLYQRDFVEMKIPLPSIKEQIAIADILTAFDDKIENLQAQNKTLEQTAQTIFKEWFGKYQIGDELPEGWTFEKLETISDHIKDNIKPFNHPEKDYLHYSLPAYDNGLVPEMEKGATIKSNKYKVIDNSFLVSKLNPFTPRIWTIFNSEDYHICSTEFQVVKPKFDEVFALVHCFLNSKKFTAELSQNIKGTSSSHQRVNPQDIFNINLVLPNKNDLNKFNSLVYPMVAKKNINHNQIQSLKKTRDSLLPKLVNGKIRVNSFNS